jgi:hypothetical protein
MAKKTYQELLKENLNEFDTTKTVDVKGPMLDPILGYEGDGELPTYKDAASVLERYYFGEKRSEHEINEMDYENDKGDSSAKEMKHTEGPEGEEQAGTSNANNPRGSEAEKEKDIAKESEEAVDAALKTIAEKEMNTADLKSKNMKDADGPEGEEQAGTGDTYSEFKKRVVESIEEIMEDIDEDTLTEQDEEEEGDEKEEKEDEKEEKEEEAVEENSSVPGGPSPKKVGEDLEDDEAKYSKTNESEEAELEVEEDITEALENEIIEKLISEMEDETESVIEEQDEGEAEGDAPPEKDAADEEGDEEEGLDVDKKMEEMVNRLTSESLDKKTMTHTEGPEGEEQAGTGGDEKVIPPRKDRSNEGTKEKGTKPMDKAELADA